MNYTYKALFLIFIILLFNIYNLSAQNNFISFYESDQSLVFLSDNKVNTEIFLDSIDLHYLNAVIFHLTNIERVKKNLELLKFHHNLYKSSILHSEKMIEHDFFNHINKIEKKWSSPSDRILYFDNSYISLAENILENNILNYKGKSLVYRTEYSDDGSIIYLDLNGEIISYSTYIELSERLLAQWMNSTPHRKNILNSSFNLMGCACAIDKTKIPALLRCTQNFGQIN